MKKIERRIKALVHNHPGIRNRQIIEYLGLHPAKVNKVLEDMKAKGALVAKPVEIQQKS